MGLDAEFGAPPSGRPHSPESVTVRRWRYMLMSLTVTAAVVVRGNPSMLDCETLGILLLLAGLGR